MSTRAPDAVDLVIYDTGTFPGWVKLPCLLAGIVCLFLAIEIAGRPLFFPLKPVGQGTLPASLAFATFAYVLIHIWIIRRQIVWEPGSCLLRFDFRGVFGTSHKRFPAANVLAIESERVESADCEYWLIVVVDHENRRTKLRCEFDDEEIQAVTDAIRVVMGLPSRNPTER